MNDTRHEQTADSENVDKLFSIVINNQSICGLRNTYYWVAYLQQILCFQEDARKSRLEEVGFYEDANPATTNFITPSGSRTRALLTDESKKLSINKIVCLSALTSNN